MALLVGTEGAGLTEAATSLADYRVRIQIRAEVDSLNLATATGIAFHRIAAGRRREPAGGMRRRPGRRRPPGRRASAAGRTAGPGRGRLPRPALRSSPVSPAGADIPASERRVQGPPVPAASGREPRFRHPQASIGRRRAFSQATAQLTTHHPGNRTIGQKGSETPLRPCGLVTSPPWTSMHFGRKHRAALGAFI